MNESEKQALTALYENYRDRFYAAAFAILNNRQDAEDAVCDTFLWLSKNSGKFISIDEAKRPAYAKTALKNACLDMIRKRKRRRDEELLPEIADKSLSVEEKAEGSEAYRELSEFIRTLSPALREALYLRVSYGFCTKEIAKTLGISEAAARKRLSDAQKQIRDFIKEERK